MDAEGSGASGDGGWSPNDTLFAEENLFLTRTAPVRLKNGTDGMEVPPGAGGQGQTSFPTVAARPGYDMAPKHLQRYLHHHGYPACLFRWPRLIDPVHGWHDVMLQRNRVVRRQALRRLRTMPPTARLLDAGCGDGQHVLPLLRRFPQLSACLLDRHPDHIRFLERYCRAAGFPNAVCRQEDIRHLRPTEPFDLVLCVGVLQYIADDGAALSALYRALRPGGILLLYVPVNGRRILPRLSARMLPGSDYEAVQQRRRIYRPAGVEAAVRAAGFRQLACHATYGPLGTAGHELYQGFLRVLAHARSWRRLWLLPALALLPLALALVRIDAMLPKKDGNGRLLVAQRPDDAG